MKNIAAYTHFLTEAHCRQIAETAGELGFTATFYDAETDRERFFREVGDYEILYGYIPVEALAGAKHLRWLCSASAGMEQFMGEVEGLRPDCLLTNSSGAYGPTISEHILMVLLMLMRRMPEYQAAAAERAWPYYTPIRSIIGSHVVMVGTGDIGSNTARRLKALGAAVTGVCRSGKSGEPAFDRVVSVSEMDSVLPEADAVVMAVPGTPAAAGLLSRERIALLPPRAYVVNVGRGSAIDQEALVEALQAGRLAGAALDVMTPEPLPPDHPLWTCPNTIITPHVSGNMSLGLTCDLDVDMFCRNLRRYAAGEPLEHLVDRRRGY